MSSVATGNRIDPTDPVFKYVTGPPPPRSSVSERDIDEAVSQLEAAARLATTPDAQGRRWVPGLSAVVVVRGSDNICRVRYCEGHGTTSVDDPASVGPDTLFPCASVSKPVSTTLLAAAGVGEKLGWDHVVSRNGGEVYHLANSPASHTTLRQWLSHRSGMPDHGGDLIEDMSPSMTRDNLIARVLRYQTDIEPGAFRYTNCGFTIGCLGAAAALGHAEWETFAETELARLGMHRSTFTFTSAFDGTTDRVLPHLGKPEPPDLLSSEPIGWTWRVVDRQHERNPSRQAPAGSLLSSARDLGQFLHHHLSGRFGDFPPRNPPAGETIGKSYSLGWNVVNHSDADAFERFGAQALNAISFNHSGAFSLGAGTVVRFDPDAGVGIAVLSNGEPTGVAEALAQLFFNYVYGHGKPQGCDNGDVLACFRSLMMGALYATKIANHERYHAKTVATPDRIPQGEVFRGHSDYYDCDIAIERRGDGLVLTMGSGPHGDPLWRFPLRCVDAETSTFVYATTGENEVGLSGIRLVWNGGAIVRIADDWLSSGGPDEPGTGLGVIDAGASATRPR